MTPAEEIEWQQRLRAAVEETVRRRQARRQRHADHAAARDAGLRHRHAARLARARTAPGGAMPQTPDVAGDVLTVDVAELPDVDLTALAGALARTATWTTITPATAVILGQLAEQARRIRQQRERR